MEGCPSGSEEAGKAAGCEGCVGQEACASGAAKSLMETDDRLRVRMGAIRHRIAVMSGKGGVGKSSVCRNLAFALTSLGYKVGVLDCDLCGPSQALLAGVSQASLTPAPHGWIPAQPPACPSLRVVSSALMRSEDAPLLMRGPRRLQLLLQMAREPYWGKLHFLLVDTPPGTSDEHLRLASDMKGVVHSALLVATARPACVGPARRQAAFLRKMGLPVCGVVSNMCSWCCPCCGHVEPVMADEENEKELLKNLQCPIVGRLPLDPEAAAAGDEGRTPDTDSPYWKAMMNLAHEIVKMFPIDEDEM